MKAEINQAYLNILKEELIPAMGCTEPIAVAYAAARMRKTLGILPEQVEIRVSGNIVKNVKSVIVPHTGGMKGIKAAVAAGIVAGDADKELEVLSSVRETQIPEIASYLEKTSISIEQSDSGCIFDIEISGKAESHTAYVRISGQHTNVVRVEKDGRMPAEFKGTATMEEEEETGAKGLQSPDTDHALLKVENIVAFAEQVDILEVKDMLDHQISYNMAIAKEGLSGNWGANIGKIILLSYGDSVHNRAKAMAAAGSDARMNGCELPVVINSGSGNQGMTASIPVIVYAKELGISSEKMYRALVISNLVTIHLKSGIGRLSAYCGATSAGCGAGAGITYLYGGGYKEIAHTLVNALAINSGVICDGAKASCAAKIASSVEAGLLGMQMYLHGSEFCDGDGIIKKGVENTIENVGKLARDGMRETDREIIGMML